MSDVTQTGARTTRAADALADLAALAARVDLGMRPVIAPDTFARTRSRDAAVLVLFGPRDEIAPAAHGTSTPEPAPGARPEDLDVLLLSRATTLRAHPGQVAFPGGRAEPTDSDAADTALREATEETGLARSGVRVLGSLAPLPVPVSNHIVTPVLAWWAAPSPVRPMDPAETAHVFRAHVGDLLDPANRRTAVVDRRGRPLGSPAFVLPGHLVWGFTGLVLSSLFDAAGWSRPWDAKRTIDPLVIARS